MKLVYQPLGNNWAVGIETNDPKKIESQDFSWYNHGAYNGTLKFLSERFAYIWTTEEKLHKYLYNSSLAYLLGKYDNKLKGKVRRYARLLAKLRFNTMESEPFIKKGHGTIFRYVPQEDTQERGASGAKMGVVGYVNDEEEWKQNCGAHFTYDN
jgi:hypothetical protein